MENSKLKEIFSNLKSVVEDLEAEIYSNPNAYLKPYVHPWDEHMKIGLTSNDDDDGYPD